MLQAMLKPFILKRIILKRHWKPGKTKTEDETEPGDLLSCVSTNAFGGRAAINSHYSNIMFFWCANGSSGSVFCFVPMKKEKGVS